MAIRLEKRNIIYFTGLILLLFLVWALSQSAGYIEVLPLVMIPTGRAAFLLFWLAFMASTLHWVWSGGFTKWLLRNRRYFGLSFALVHFVHLGLVMSNLSLTSATRTVPQLSVGALAYFLLLLMAVTSNDSAVKKLGHKNWKILHKTGGWYLYLFFCLPLLKPQNHDDIGFLWIPALLLIGFILKLSMFVKNMAKKNHGRGTPAGSPKSRV